MTQVVVSERAVRDFERIANWVEAYEPASSAGRVLAIVSAVDVLASSPRIGRLAPEGHRELVIGRGSRGYAALYAYLPRRDLVVILAIRGQREAGYLPPEGSP